MAFHHVALATNDIAATHDFYTEAMGFELVKSVVAPTEAGGWAKHLFYDSNTGRPDQDGEEGGGLIAFWDLHDPSLQPVRPAISEGLGLPIWVNHLAFLARDLADLEARRDRWLDRGIDVMEIDHGFCRSMYTVDPNRILVEWCCDTAPYTEADKVEALAVLRDAAPDQEPAPEPIFHQARHQAEHAGPSEPSNAPESVPAT